MPSTISTTTKTWAIAARLTGSSTAAIGPISMIVSQTATAPVSRQAQAVTTGLKRTATHTMVSVSMNVVGVSGRSTKPNPKMIAVAAVAPKRLSQVGRARAAEGRATLVVVLGEPATDQQSGHADRGHRCDRPGGPAQGELERLRGDQQLAEGRAQQRVGEHAPGHGQEDEAEVGHRPHRLTPAPAPQVRGPASEQVDDGQRLQREQQR